LLTGLNHLTLAVADLERSFAFYKDLPGFRPAAIWNTGAYLSLGELWLCLSLDSKRGTRQEPDYTHVAFDIAQDAFAALRARLLEAGVVEWRQNRSEGDSFYFLDPDGHQLEAHVGNLATRLAKCREMPYAGMRFFD
jgi:catechol 2,3-dioxygenase-like lactoylglutathione lyase family enzyme